MAFLSPGDLCGIETKFMCIFSLPFLSLSLVSLDSLLVLVRCCFRGFSFHYTSPSTSPQPSISSRLFPICVFACFYYYFVCFVAFSFSFSFSFCFCFVFDFNFSVFYHFLFFFVSFLATSAPSLGFVVIFSRFSVRSAATRIFS